MINQKECRRKDERRKRTTSEIFAIAQGNKKNRLGSPAVRHTITDSLSVIDYEL